MKPKLVVWDNLGGFDCPNSIRNQIDCDDPSGVLFSQRDLAAGTNRLNFDWHECMIWNLLSGDDFFDHAATNIGEFLKSAGMFHS